MEQDGDLRRAGTSLGKPTDLMKHQRQHIREQSPKLVLNQAPRKATTQGWRTRNAWKADRGITISFNQSTGERLESLFFLLLTNTKTAICVVIRITRTPKSLPITTAPNLTRQGTASHLGITYTRIGTKQDPTIRSHTSFSA